MLDFVDKNLQSSNDDVSTEFAFMMPILNPHEIFREPDGTATSPADELFYRGQLLPLLLPCRLKMVQELYGSKTEHSIFSSEDADLLYKNASYTAEGAPVRLSDMLAKHEEHTLYTQMQTHRPNPISIAVPKPRLRWKLLSRRGQKCSLVEAACCHLKRSRCTSTSKEALKLEVGDVETCGSAFLRSGSCRGDLILSPKMMRSPSLSLSSMHQNPLKNCRTRRDKVWFCTANLMTSTQKESLVLKVRDCLQRSLKVFKLGRSVEPKKGSTHLQRACQHDNGSAQNSVAKNRRQVAHYDSGSNNCFTFEYEDVYGSMRMHRPRTLMNEREDNSYVDYCSEVNDDGELSSAAFITIEPSSLIPENSRSSACGFECNTSSCLAPSTWGSLNDSLSATNVELQNSIQGAIAHCKGSM